MTGAKLTQAEIDALLGGSVEKSPATSLNEVQRDALGEVGNISFGSAATSLSTLLQQRVDITTPTVRTMDARDVPSLFPHPYVMVSVQFTAGLRGTSALAIKMVDAKIIADLMLGGDGTNTAGELNELHLSAVSEAMNQMMGGAATSMSQIFGTMINISPPSVQVVDLSNGDDDHFDLQGEVAIVEFDLNIGNLIDSKIMQFVPVAFAKDMLSMIGVEGDTVASSYEEVAVTEAPLKPAPVTEVKAPVHQQPRVQAPVQAKVPEKSVAAASFAELGPVAAAAAEPPANLALLLDVPLNVTVELGRARKKIRDILDLTNGSILELDKLAGEPVDILVNGRQIAIGEVVVIDENFGVRVTDILSPNERVKKLKD